MIFRITSDGTIKNTQMTGEHTQHCSSVNIWINTEKNPIAEMLFYKTKPNGVLETDDFDNVIPEWRKARIVALSVELEVGDE